VPTSTSGWVYQIRKNPSKRLRIWERGYPRNSELNNFSGHPVALVISRREDTGSENFLGVEKEV
jgi:hypothetical protein